jgi:hypothetical protein
VAVVRFTALGHPSGRSPKRAATSPPWQWGVNCTRWVAPRSRGGDFVRWRSSILPEADVAVCGQTWMLLNYRGPIAHLLCSEPKLRALRFARRERHRVWHGVRSLRRRLGGTSGGTRVYREYNIEENSKTRHILLVTDLHTRTQHVCEQNVERSSPLVL